MDDPVEDLFDETVGAPAESGAEETVVDPGWPEDVPPPDPDGPAFDAFNATTWNFKPAPTPWYRTRQSVVAMAAASIAVLALVVSVALLTVRGPSETEDLPATQTSSAPTTATTPETTSAVPPPLPPPPPPPPPTASEIKRAPVIVRPTRQTKKPEINVTRSPMSVSPQKPSGRQ